MTRPSQVVCAALLACVGVLVPACDPADGSEPEIEAEAFESGVARDTDGGAFRVTLDSRTGLSPGEDDALIAHVGFHLPSDPDGPGLGVPSATVHLDLHRVSGESDWVELEGTHVGEGRYAFEILALEPGTWEFDFQIEVGESLDESAVFVFAL